ncbi:PTS sugar transporter, partial [Listeria monocytogenes]
MKDVFESQRNNTEILVGMLEERLDIKIPAFEVGYIQLHLTAAYNQQHDELLVNTPPQEDDVADFVSRCLAEGNYDKGLLEDLTTHMKSAINRLKLGMHF